MRDAPNARRRDAGQAAIEFALALPLLAIAVLGAAQVVDPAADGLAVGAPARAGARAPAAAQASFVGGGKTARRAGARHPRRSLAPYAAAAS